ncbi:MAG: 2Fe-2S iron-sulfur cluster-binding protein [Trueperaceae bacterium]
MLRHLNVSVYRFDPAKDGVPRYDTFSVPAFPEQRVLDVLRYIYENEASDLAFEFACRTSRCGTCSVLVNGRSVLACQERAKPNMRVEPLSPPFPVVRDLVVSRQQVDDNRKRLNLTPVGLESTQGGIPSERGPLRISEEKAEKQQLINSCINCQLCVTECPAVHLREFEGPMLMAQLRRLDEHPVDRQDRAGQAVEGGLYECFSCDICTEVCPVEIPLADQIRHFRQDILFGDGS